MPTSKSSVPATQKTGSSVEHAEPWKEDGNIVLCAERKYFRVHRSVLSDQSEIFRDMFDCPHFNEVEKELVDQCPVVHLSDSADDLQVMLNALYNRSYPLPYNEKIPLSYVVVFSRIGEKYGIPALVKEARARLCCSFEPTSLPTMFSAEHTFSNLFPDVTGGDPHHFQIMNLLQEMDMKASLPVAMYRCVALCPLSNVVQGYRSNDSICSLSPVNLRAFIHMKDMIDSFRFQLVKSVCSPPSCVVFNCTRNMRRVWLERVVTMVPFDPWSYEWNKLFCEGCRGQLKDKRDAAITKAWSKLPTAFGFDSWEDVKKSVG